MGNSDISIKETLQEDVKIPEIVNDSLDEAYDKIRKEEVRMKSLRSRSKKRLYRKLGVAAAAACMVLVLTGVFFVNPALAKDIPILGDLFGRIQEIRDNHPYPEKDKTAYENIAKHSEPVKDPTNVAEDQGITMTVSDAYCDGYDLYFTLSLQTGDEELNAADQLNLLCYRDGDPIAFFAWLYVNGEETYSTYTLSPAKSEDGLFVTLVRVPAINIEAGKFPEDVTVSMDIGAVGAQKFDEPYHEEIKNYERVGYKCVEGSWKLQFKASSDTSQNRTAKPEAENNGFVVEEVTLTPSNAHMVLHIPAEWEPKNPAVVLMDTQGNRVQDESEKIIKNDDGTEVRYITFDHSDANDFVLQMYDKNGEPDKNGGPRMIAEIPFSVE